MMGLLALLLVLVQPAAAIEGTYMYRGNMDAPYHSISFGPITSLTHLGQEANYLKYQAEQDVTLDGQKYSTVTYVETTSGVRFSIGNPTSPDYQEFEVAQNGIRKIGSSVRWEAKNLLASVTVNH